MRRYLLMLCLLCPAVVAADAYRWVDEKGQVHYGDRPPAQAERLDLPSNPEGTDTPTDENATDEDESESAARDDSCAAMRERLASYRSAGKLARTNAAGEEVIMSDEEKAGVIARFENKVAAECDEGA